MVEIYKTKTNAGFILIATVIIMALLLFLSTYVISFAITELKISSSKSSATQAYYLAESGVAEAIWKIKNDSTWKTNFETDPDWVASTTRSQALYTNGSYHIDIQNSGLARADITVTGYINVGKSTAQRVIRATVYKAIGTSVLPGTAKYSANGIDISGSTLTTHGGGMFSNNNTQIGQSSIVTVSGGPVKAVNNLIVNSGSFLYASTTIDKHNTPAPTSTPMPSVSFDTYKAGASQTYTESQFSNLLLANQGKTLTLNGITYVYGNIVLKGSAKLVINGALVADNSVTVGATTNGCCWNSNCNGTNITINRIDPDDPSGILSKNGISFQSCLKSFTGTGIIYSSNGLTFSSVPNKIFSTGALICANGLSISSSQIDLTYDTPSVSYSLGGNPQFSPIVTVNHWEEEY